MPFFDKIKVGNVEVPIYHVLNRGRDYLYIKYSWAGEPKMRSVRYAGKRDEQRARSLAREIAASIYNNRGQHIADMGQMNRVMRAAEDALTDLKIPVDAACREYAQAREIIGDTGTVTEAATFFRKSKPGSARSMEIGEAVKKYLVALKADGVGKRHLQDSNNRLTRFAEYFSAQEIGELSAGDMQNWLRSLDVAPRTRNNYRDRIAAMFHWAQSENYLRRDVPTEADELKVIPAPHEIHIYPNETVAEVLHGAEEHDPRCIHYLALGFFAFIRPAEISRMTDLNIRFRHNDIEILPAIAKGEKRKPGRRRLIPIQPGLRAWFDAYALAEGPLIVPKTREYVTALTKKLKIKWHHDVMRHTGISHAVAMTQNVDQVALWAGNSRDIIYESYLNQVPEREGKLFFTAILPEMAADRKVIRIAR